MKKIFKDIDINGNNTISYNEFRRAMKDLKVSLQFY